MSSEEVLENQARPRVSVIVPVFNGGPGLDDCLAAVGASSYPVFECILVDDASTDGMAGPAARRHGARLIRLDRQSGPSQARNLGAAEAGGEILFFTDADVLLHPDALGKAVSALESDPEIGAVFGSYDDQPGHASFLSQYRNLYHHWIHQTGSEEASTFWAGCGAVRREVFDALGGFSRDYARPSIEDIELGHRLRRCGHRIRLEKSMLGKHMKHWKFWNLIRTDVFSRGVPWMALVLRDRNAPSDLNLSLNARIATLLAVLLVLSLLVLPVTGHARAALPALAFLLAASAGAWLAGPLGRPPAMSILAVLLAFLAPLAAYASAPDPLALVPLALVLALVWTHWGFYRHVARLRGAGFAAAVVPMQVLFFLGCAVSIPLGLVEHRVGGRRDASN